MRVAPSKAKKHSISVVLLVGFILCVCNAARGEQLPLKTYTTADGLPRDYISRIIRDSHGFLWFCTPEGLSRFDGYDFVNYGIEQGLPNASVRDLLEDHDGTYLIATGGGLVLFNPFVSRLNTLPTTTSSSSKFETLRPSDNERDLSINVLQEEEPGVIWCGTDAGLYRLEKKQNKWIFSFVDIGLPKEIPEFMSVWALLKDRRGALWIGTQAGLYRRLPDGRVERYTSQQGLPFNDVRALLEDQDGRLWAGTTLGLCQLAAEPDPHRRSVARVFTVQTGLANNLITSLFLSVDGRLWAGTAGGLSEFVPTAGQDQLAFRSYTAAQGLSDKHVKTLAEDRAGNLWLGTESGGAMKIAHNGFTTYAEADGLIEGRIASILESRTGDLLVISSRAFIHRFEGRRFSATKPSRLGSRDPGWGWNQITFQDRNDEWWVPTSQGLCRFSKLTNVEHFADAHPKAIYTTRDGLTGNQIFRLFEDQHGDVWIATLDNAQSAVTRWERSTETFHRYTSSDGMPPTAPTVFREDRAGGLWLGFYSGGLVRYSAGHFTMFTSADGVPEGMVRDLYVDRTGRLWAATNRGGLVRVDEPTAEHPRFVTYTTAQGLSSNQVTCVTEDQWGRLYIGTGRGLDRLDPATGHIKHYTATDGLGNNFVNVSFRDHFGALWFGTLQGLARLIPEPDHTPSPPAILIAGLRVEGEPQPLSDLGESAFAGLVLGPDQNQLQIEFVGLSLGLGETLRYQIKLEGVDSDWGALTENRAINYVHLAAGSYRFLVRAVDVEGITSTTPASVSFKILPPIWRRWWFMTLAATLIGLVVYTVYRRHVGRLIELERVRTRIATDLHDDIGSSLSQIAILSEVARRQLTPSDRRVNEPLTLIATASRELIDGMSDIVWAINPRKDRVRDLAQRMRRFASDMFATRNIALSFRAPDKNQSMKIDADVKRQVFLIFKESVHNAVRHSGCTEAEIGLQITKDKLRMSVSDNGRGFEVNANEDGHGLLSMRQRAHNLRATLTVNCEHGKGTKVELDVPLNPSRLPRWRNTAT